VGSYQSSQLNALGDATRRAILARLLDAPLAVGELARELPVSRPAVSQHLRILKRAELVVNRPVGTRRVYAVNPAGIGRLREYFDRIWAEALSSFKRAVEEPPPEQAKRQPAPRLPAKTRPVKGRPKKTRPAKSQPAKTRPAKRQPPHTQRP
jgi:DNA-binding transcriptional ArsR family regulator